MHWRGGEHRGTLCSHLIFLESSLWRKKEERERKKKKKLSMFMWKPSCGNSPGVWSHCSWRTWRWIFLNPTKPQGLYLEGVIRGKMEMHHLKKLCNPSALYGGHVLNLQDTRSCLAVILFILKRQFLYIFRMLWQIGDYILHNSS